MAEAGGRVLKVDFMNIGEAIDEVLRHINYDNAIFAKRPWTVSSAAVISNFDAGYKTPERLEAECFEYFLESAVVEELSDVKKTRLITPVEFNEMVVYYAEYDCCPEWVNELPKK